jgi:hypothetical protein
MRVEEERLAMRAAPLPLRATPLGDLRARGEKVASGARAYAVFQHEASNSAISG